MIRYFVAFDDDGTQVAKRLAAYHQYHADNATPPRTLARLLGHSTVRVTMQFYNRVTDANEQAAAATVDRLLAADCHSIATGASSEGVA